MGQGDDGEEPSLQIFSSSHCADVWGANGQGEARAVVLPPVPAPWL